MSRPSTTSFSSTREISPRYLCDLENYRLHPVTGFQVSVAIPVVYLVSTWIFTGVNVSLVTAVPLHARIGLGYALFLLSLIAIPFIDLMVHSCVLSIHVAYYLTILSVAIVGIGSGGQ